MPGPTVDGLIEVDIAVANLHIEAAFGIGACPRLEMDGGSLPTEVGKGHQLTGAAGLTLGQMTNLHRFLLAHIRALLMPADGQSGQAQGVAWAAWMYYSSVLQIRKKVQEGKNLC